MQMPETLGKYILDGHEVVPEYDLLKWAEWFENAKRIVRRDIVTCLDQLFLVSTVFLGLDHQFGDGPPILFETMIFLNGNEYRTERCSTWEEAEEQHAAIVRELEEACTASKP